MSGIGGHIPRGQRIRERQATTFDVMAARARTMLDELDELSATESGPQTALVCREDGSRVIRCSDPVRSAGDNG